MNAVIGKLVSGLGAALRKVSLGGGGGLVLRRQKVGHWWRAEVVLLVVVVARVGSVASWNVFVGDFFDFGHCVLVEGSVGRATRIRNQTKYGVSSTPVELR